MTKKRTWVLAAVAAVALASGTNAADPTATPKRGGQLKPWVPVDAAFSACSSGFCGRRGHNKQAVAQPGARPGQIVYCPVSGAVFTVSDSSKRAAVNGKTLYVCCEGCARYFEANRARVLALRGLAL